jgi:serine/threonine protein phosphatase 1
VRVYAIGDVHGRADLLVQLRERIRADLAEAPPTRLLVHVGDYVDRGFESRKVLDLLIERPLAGVENQHLLGNHDAWLLGFLDEPASVGAAWLRFGGDATLLSYDVRLNGPAESEEDLAALAARLRARLPAAHRRFLEGLRLRLEFGDYLFVHAGIRPGVPLALQKPDDLLWIREPFLSDRRDHGMVVVHGHTVQAQPVVRANRIGIDTGACWTGRLTCLVLEGEGHRFLAVPDSGGDR